MDIDEENQVFNGDDEIQLPIPGDELQHPNEDEDIQLPIPGDEIQHPHPNEDIQLPFPNEEIHENVANVLNANLPTFSLIIEGNHLNAPLRTEQNGNVLAWEQFLLTIAQTLRFKECYKSMLTSFRQLNRLFVNANFPTDMRKFWQIVDRRDDHFREHVVCTLCWHDLGEGKVPTIDCRCNPVQCGPDQDNVHLGTFLYLNLRAQIENLFRKSRIAEDLLYPYTRIKRNEEAMEDVYDGTQYRIHSTDEGSFLHRRRHNYSFAMWVDGVSPFNSSNVQIVPVFFQILELSPRARQRNTLLAALYVGPRKVSMPHFLRPVTIELEELYREGVNWQPRPNEMRQSRFMVLIVSADSEERYTIFGMTRHNGHHGCTCCLVDGVVNEEAENHTLIYPIRIEQGVRDRTDAGIRSLSELAAATRAPQLGVRCISPLYPLRINLRTSQLMEPLHLFWECVFKRLYGNFTDPDAPNRIRPADIEIISKRILTIRTPTKISRLPRPLSEISNFTGTQLRNTAWLYWLPCAHEFLSEDQLRLSHLFAEFSFILHKDSILPEELDRALQLIHEFRQLFQNVFPANQCVYSLHLLIHAVQSVRDLGPCFVASGLWFESLNRQVINYLTSPNDRAKQVACRMLLRQMIEGYLDQNLTPGTLQELQELIQKERWTELPEEATGVFVQLRDPGRAGQLDEDQFTALEEIGVNNIYPGFPITTYSKITISGVIYQVDKGTTKYNNSIAYVNVPHADDVHFIQINSIISWRNGNREHRGIFGTPFRTIDLAFETTFMHEVDELDDYLVFIPMSDILLPGVLVEVNGRTWISQWANRWDND